MKNELELFDCGTAKKLAENNRQVFGNIQRNSQGGYLFNEVQATAIKTELEENEWYTIEELAALCGYDARTLKHSENNLASIADKMSLNLEVNTRMGGYHNTQKFYSEKVLKALKEYQLKNSVPNAVKDKETVSEKTMTTKELAETLGVDVDTVNITVNRLGFSDVLRKSTGGRPTKVFTEQQATLIKQEIQKHHNLATRQIDTVSTELEENEMIIKSMQILAARKARLEKQIHDLQMENATQQRQLEEQKPKVEYFDSYMDASNLSEIGQLGKVTKIGERNIFKVMVADGYIRGKCVDGIFYYVPNYGYERYFETIPVPFTKQGKQLSRDKLMLTREGFVYFMKKYKSN